MSGARTAVWLRYDVARIWSVARKFHPLFYIFVLNTCVLIEIGLACGFLVKCYSLLSHSERAGGGRVEPWSDTLRHITTYYDISDMSCHTTYPTCPTCPSGAEVLWVCQGMPYCLPTCPTYPTSLRCPTCPTSHTHNTLTDTPPHPLISRPNLQNMHWHMI